MAEAPLSSQPFRFRKWLIVSRGALLRLRLHHLVEPAGNKDSHVLLQTCIFSAAFFGIESKTDNVPIRCADQYGRRFGGGGVADLSRIPQIDVQHGENVRLVVFRTWISDLAAAICAGARAQSERESQEQQSRPKTSARPAHCCLPAAHVPARRSRPLSSPAAEQSDERDNYARPSAPQQLNLCPVLRRCGSVKTWPRSTSTLSTRFVPG